MSSKSKSTTSMSRPAFLNVIYFIDSRKTRSFKLSLNKLQFALYLLLAMTVWSIVSVFVLIYSWEERQALTDRLNASLSTIFEYQSRYDQVYEQAYPRVKQEVTPIVQVPPIPVAAKTIEEKPPEAVKPKPSVVRIPKDINWNNMSVTTKNWPVVVAEPIISRNKQDLQLNLAIKNKNSPTLAEGYIWAILSVRKPDNSITYLSSPKEISVKAGKISSNPSSSANWYSIRYYKTKNFYFPIPAELDGDLIAVKIGMLDLQDRRNSYVFNLSPKSPN